MQFFFSCLLWKDFAKKGKSKVAIRVWFGCGGVIDFVMAKDLMRRRFAAGSFFLGFHESISELRAIAPRLHPLL